MIFPNQWPGVWAAAAGLSGLPQPSLQIGCHREKEETRQTNCYITLNDIIYNAKNNNLNIRLVVTTYYTYVLQAETQKKGKRIQHNMIEYF
jgi:hypothetical protein